MSDVKEEILNSAKKHFDRFGYKKTTLDDIARDMKISKKTIYEHFEDKEDLFVSLFIRETLRARNGIFEEIPDSINPLEKLKVALERGVYIFSKDSFLVRVLRDDESLYSPFLTTKYHNLVEEGIITIIADILAEGKEKGLFRDVNEKAIAYYLFKLFQSVTYAKTVDMDVNEGTTKEIIDFIFNGIVKQYNYKC
jgi:AcrR family transcriptional regulator